MKPSPELVVSGKKTGIVGDDDVLCHLGEEKQPWIPYSLPYSQRVGGNGQYVPETY